MANDACDKAPLRAGNEQSSRLCDHAVQMAFSPTASRSGTEAEISQADRDKANVLMLKTPALTMAAADNGQYSATIMRVGPAGDRSAAPPQLTGASQSVFAKLQSAGLNPTVENIYSRGTQNWEIRANWKSGEKGDADLQLRTEAAVKRQSAEKAAKELQSFEADMRAADATVLKAPGLARQAADSGADSVAIAKVASIYSGMRGSGDPRAEAPQLSAAQQKIFDGLKAEGLNPSVEPGQWSNSSSSYSEKSWVIKANWKDGENPDQDLNVAMHAAKDRAAAAQAEASATNAIERRNQVDETIAMIPALSKQAEIDHKDAFGVLTLGNHYPTYGVYPDKPPKLDAYQQRVFDELARRNLSPSIEASSVFAPVPPNVIDKTGTARGYGYWVLTAHRNKPSGTP